MTFTQRIQANTQSVYEAILAHPFIRALADGTLSRDRFAYYVQQDALYLRDYARALALLAAKAPEPGVTEELLTYARDGVDVERALHEQFMTAFAIEPAKEQEPACFAYTRYLLATVALDAYEVGLAAVLPCFWIYREVGSDIARRSVSSNPYAPWIKTYSDETFLKSVKRMLDLTDAAACTASTATQAAMERAYAVSARYEWSFWDAAWRMDHRPV